MILEPSKTEKWSASQIGREGAGQTFPLPLTIVTFDSHSPTQPPTKTVETVPSPTGVCILHSARPHCSVSVGVPKHLPLSPSHLLVLCLIPPVQVLEQELKEPQELHFFLLPLLQSLGERQSSTSEFLPTQVTPLLGAPLSITVLATLGAEQLLCRDLVPAPQVAEQELQLPHLVQLSSSLQVSELQVLVWISWPGQLEPALHVLTRTFLPPPHDLEHGLHTAQLDQEPACSIVRSWSLAALHWALQ